MTTKRSSILMAPFVNCSISISTTIPGSGISGHNYSNCLYRENEDGFREEFFELLGPTMRRLKLDLEPEEVFGLRELIQLFGFCPNLVELGSFGGGSKGGNDDGIEAQLMSGKALSKLEKIALLHNIAVDENQFELFFKSLINRAPRLSDISLGGSHELQLACLLALESLDSERLAGIKLKMNPNSNDKVEKLVELSERGLRLETLSFCFKEAPFPSLGLLLSKQANCLKFLSLCFWIRHQVVAGESLEMPKMVKLENLHVYFGFRENGLRLAFPCPQNFPNLKKFDYDSRSRESGESERMVNGLFLDSEDNHPGIQTLKVGIHAEVDLRYC
jgi:hypothetical protein